MFLEAHSFSLVLLLEDRSLLRIENNRGQISKHIFAPSRGYGLFKTGLLKLTVGKASAVAIVIARLFSFSQPLLLTL